MQKFPHTRAQLAVIGRQYSAKQLNDNSNHGTESAYDNDSQTNGLGLADEDGELNRVSTSFVNRVVGLLVNENEDELKTLLKDSYHIDDDEHLEQNVLDLMHKHRDDVAGVPFLFLTPTRRPISRPSSRASSHSHSALSSGTRLYPARPGSPISAPTSPLAHVFRRPHTPVTSPLASGTLQHQAPSYMTARSSTGSDYSPQSSPILAHAQAQATQAHAQFTASLPASPISSPRLLNAKASEFRPVIQRPLSAAPTAPSSFLRAESPDLWAHTHGPGSPNLRATSNLAIAAPLIAEQSPSFQPRSLTPSSSLRTSLLPGDDDDDDPFDPFRPNPTPHTFHAGANANRAPDEYDNMPWYHTMPPHNFTDSPPNELQVDPNNPNQNPVDLVMGAGGEYMFTDGMTPFDVLTSVFGSTLAPSELEEALANNGYDFDRAMAWLVDRTLPPSGGNPPQSQQPQQRMQNMGGRVTLVSRGGPPGGRGGYHNGARFGNGAAPVAPGRNGRPPPGGNNRVCRYFMAGECLRADCRFSHDLERALCRFWLRGTCAKGEQCEFLHHLPKDTDMNSLSIAMARANVAPGTGPLAAVTAGHTSPQDEFPALGYEGGAGRGQKRYGGFDPGRTRFAAAVKKPFNNTATDNAPGSNGTTRMSIVAPRPSPRLRLRPPQLMPTLPTGEVVNNLYMSYRSRALQLGAARNASLSRAAEAWRRGDGAAAKRFSREGHEMNAKMSAEMASAAEKVVRERARVAEAAVKQRDSGWSDDPRDRSTRGQPCGGGFGVILGVASAGNVGTGDEGKALTSEERMEAMLDLHGLHSNEATEVLEQYLLAIESEHFYGLVYTVVGEEKHTGNQDPGRGVSRNRLASGVKEWLHRWGYPWSERDGIICIDPLTHASE